MLHEPTALACVRAALPVGAISPRPRFVMVTRMTVSSSRSQAIGPALGMGVGALLFTAAALPGLKA